MPRNKSLLKGRSKASNKITIRPYRKPPSLPANYYEETVQPLLDGTLVFLDSKNSSKSNANKDNNRNRNVINNDNTKLSLQNAYTAIVTLVRHQYGPALYKDWVASLQQAVERVLPSSQQQQAMLLQYIPAVYQTFLEYLSVCKHIFSPLDRTHVWNATTQQAQPGTSAAASSSNTQQSLWTVGLVHFSQRLQQLKLPEPLYQQWLQTLLKDWHAPQQDWTTRQDLQAVWYLWQDLGWLTARSPLVSLQVDLEQHWLRQGQEQWSGDAAAFLVLAQEQHQHCTQWPWLPVPWLWHILDTQLIQPQLPALLEHVGDLVQRELTSTASTKSQDSALGILWRLAGRLPEGQPQVITALCAFLKKEGLRRLQTGVLKLWQLQEQVSKIIAGLPNHQAISLKNVWEEVVNANGHVAEQLAKCLDMILKNNKKLDLYQQTNPQWLSNLIGGLFVPLQAKDVFEAFYKRDLAKRLLGNRVVSMDVEKQVCSLFKAECGAQYTSKMEGMFQDIDLSRESMMLYKQQSSDVPATGVDMEVQILTTGYWPVYPQFPNLHLPASLKEPQEHFDAHYKKKCHGRRITWQYALGNCIVKMVGFAKPYDLVVSLCQALVLIQFDSPNSVWTLPALMQAVGLEDRGEMERTLQSLALGKTRVLRKVDAKSSSKPRFSVDDKDQFRIQTAFSSNIRRIRIQNVHMKETKEDRDKTVQAVSRDRLYLMDAVLVRILKARKTVMHQQLIPQVLEQVKFPAQASDVKKRIESLIEREYMERDAKDRNRYNYLA